MPLSKYRVRFHYSEAPKSQERSPTTTLEETQSDVVTKHTKSRTGCQECRRRRVKCDESFPVCLACQRRKTVCLVEPKVRKWRAEIPGISIRLAPKTVVGGDTHIDCQLLEFWLEKVSQIMVLDPEVNPFSFPILQLLEISPWMAYILQCISAAYKSDFVPSQLTVSCLEGRQRALVQLRKEVNTPKSPQIILLLGIFMLGLSTSWIDGDVTRFGKTHLQGGRAILDLILQEDKPEWNKMERFVIGSYIFWDMACSLLVGPLEQTSLRTPKLDAFVDAVHGSYHPISGFAIKLFYILGELGRYCRRVVDLHEYDYWKQAELERELIEWESSSDDHELEMLGDAFRHHGLILLYRICGFSPYSEYATDETEDTEERIHQHALQALQDLKCTPLTSTNVCMQAIPLMTAGSELNEEDGEEREEVLKRYRALYSINRSPANTWAMELLEEHWSLNSPGCRRSWVVLMLRKGWRLCLA